MPNLVMPNLEMPNPAIINANWYCVLVDRRSTDDNNVYHLRLLSKLFMTLKYPGFNQN